MIHIFRNVYGIYVRFFINFIVDLSNINSDHGVLYVTLEETKRCYVVMPECCGGDAPYIVLHLL